jgi:small neutral amino acid transporter SnatA (MarC family)
MIGPAEVFTIFFVTLGPLKVLGPFAQRTRGMDDALVQKIALTAFVMGAMGIIAGGFVGRALLVKWNVSIGSMAVAAGIIFFIVALRQLLEQYEPPHAASDTPLLPPSPIAAALRILFPILLTPYGIATVIVLLAASSETTRTETIVALLVGVMILDLLAMLVARKILVGVTMLMLQILGGVLGVLQAALAVEFVVRGLQLLKVIAG